MKVPSDTNSVKEQLAPKLCGSSCAPAGPRGPGCRGGRRTRRHLVAAAVVVVAAVAGAPLQSCSPGEDPDADGGSGTASTTTLVADPDTETPGDTVGATAAPDCSEPATCTTRELADAAGVTFGAAVLSSHLDDERFVDTLLANFNSITPENELKWDAVQPERGEWDFAAMDELVEFATVNGLAVKGHNLLWEQESVDSTPDWVLAITDPDELRSVVREHITTVMQRYSGVVDRWDVVNEPLETLGSAPHANHFREVLGPDWIAEVFAMARAADPSARLFLNEATVELLPDKAAAFVALAADLVARDVPVDGVGIQGHLVAGSVAPGIFADLVSEISALGLEVAVTELDVLLVDGDDPLAAQATAYRTVVGECLAAGCSEVTLWGLTDRYTWIDDMFGPDREPLPFDEEYRPKPALEAIREQFAAAA